MSSDAFNTSRIATVVVVILTSNLGLAAAPGNVLLSASETGLPKDSVANVSQIITVDKELLVERVGAIPPAVRDHIAHGLRLIFGLAL